MKILSLGFKTTLLGMGIIFICFIMLMIIIYFMSSGMKKTKHPEKLKNDPPQKSEEIIVPSIVEDNTDDEIAAIAAVIAYLDSEGASPVAKAPTRIRKPFDPWTVSGRQDLMNTKL